MEFSTSVFKRIIKSQGNKRTSKDAAESLAEEVEEYASEVADEAIDLAEDDSRKTVRATDVKQALRG